MTSDSYVIIAWRRLPFLSLSLVFLHYFASHHHFLFVSAFADAFAAGPFLSTEQYLFHLISPAQSAYQCVSIDSPRKMVREMAHVKLQAVLSNDAPADVPLLLLSSSSPRFCLFLSWPLSAGTLSIWWLTNSHWLTGKEVSLIDTSTTNLFLFFSLWLDSANDQSGWWVGDE